MAITAYIREIGRGRDGARPLNQEQAHDLMSQVLDARVTDLEIGAFALAMRIKGESIAELQGFMAAVGERCLPLRSDRAVVVLPSYNGSRRIPNLTALLALLLARRGVRVLVHGPQHDAARVTTAQIFGALGCAAAQGQGDVDAAWSRGEPAFMHTDVLCPPLAELLAIRAVVGVRNSGHTVAKLMAAFPIAPTLRVVNFTHPEYATLLAELIATTRATALLMRGTEGEPVADARRLQKLDVFLAGEHRADLSRPAQDGVLAEIAALPASDAAATARYIADVAAGARPVPTPIAAQLACIEQTLAAMPSDNTSHGRTPAVAAQLVNAEDR